MTYLSVTAAQPNAKYMSFCHLFLEENKCKRGMGLWPHRAMESITNPGIIPMCCLEYQIYFHMQGRTQFNSDISEHWEQTWKQNCKSKAARCNYQEAKYREMILNYYCWGTEPAVKLIKVWLARRTILRCAASLIHMALKITWLEGQRGKVHLISRTWHLCKSRTLLAMRWILSAEITWLKVTGRFWRGSIVQRLLLLLCHYCEPLFW